MKLKKKLEGKVSKLVRNEALFLQHCVNVIQTIEKLLEFDHNKLTKSAFVDLTAVENVRCKLTEQRDFLKGYFF
jgi:predicted ribosome-associated RNA-binding protein Tma20